MLRPFATLTVLVPLMLSLGCGRPEGPSESHTELHLTVSDQRHLSGVVSIVVSREGCSSAPAVIDATIDGAALLTFGTAADLPQGEDGEDGSCMRSERLSWRVPDDHRLPADGIARVVLRGPDLELGMQLSGLDIALEPPAALTEIDELRFEKRGTFSAAGASVLLRDDDIRSREVLATAEMEEQSETHLVFGPMQGGQIAAAPFRMEVRLSTAPRVETSGCAGVCATVVYVDYEFHHVVEADGTIH